MYRLVNYFIALVWLVNGLVAKILNFVPRHEQIVARVLSEKYAFELIKIIGVLELLMVVWILSRYKTRSCAKVQILVILLMNFIEFFAARDLLLFGGFNLLFAFIFVSLIYLNEYVLKPKNA